MQLEATKSGVLRFKATFTLDRFNRYTIALPSVLGTRQPRRARLPGMVGTGGRDDSGKPDGAHSAASGYSALRNSATIVSARIFTSSPSDQLAM